MKKTKTLKIDKDIFPNDVWLREYVKTIVLVCKIHKVKVNRIQITESRFKGIHFYITINPEIDAHKVIFLQFLLGDDSQRVDYCRARIDSGLEGWNKLFWVIGRRLKTIYKAS